MLLRNKPPNKGLWNGVGGHIEPGESPYESCLREVIEETGFQVDSVDFKGVLTWKGFEIDEGGLYIFTGLAPRGNPITTDEGRLAWLPKHTVLHSPEVVENIHYFGPIAFSNAQPSLFNFEYNQRTILNHQFLPLPEEINIFKPYKSL